jgi:uncharacterized membrane protein YkvI
MKEKKSFFDGSFGKYLLPGILLQSVLIGGGYATGREIVAYGAKYGAMGWVSGLASMIGFAVIAALTFEIARVFHAYDYKSMIKVLIGPLWPIFDIAYVSLMILIIAVMASASGSIVEETTGMNYWVGVVCIIVITGLLVFFGDSLIERFETYGTILLYVGYIIFTLTVIVNKGGNIPKVFASGDTSYVSNAGIGTAIWSGIIYVAYNLCVYPSSMFSLKRQKTRKECLGSGLIAGLLMTIPWFLTYFAMMSFYPDASVLSADIPWLVMIGSVNAPGAFTVAFGIVIGWTLIETSTGVIHALLGRVNVELKERKMKELSRGKQGLLTVVILIIACALSKYGITDLIDVGYTYLSYAFIILYMLPIITVGVYKILKKEPLKKGGTRLIREQEESETPLCE